MNRIQRVLAFVLVLQVILSVVLLRPRKISGGAGEKLLAGVAAEDVISIIVDGGESGSVELRKTDGSWTLPAADNYPASDSKVSDALTKLVTFDTRRLITRTPASHKRLQVSNDEYVRRIEIKTAAGGDWVIFLGSSPSYGATHVRLDGKNETYLAGNASSWEFGTTAASWVDTTYVSVPEEQISSVTIKNGLGQVTLNHDTAGKWALADLAGGEVQNDDAVRTVVTRVSSVTLQAPLGKTIRPEYGLDKPLAVVTVQRKDGGDPLVLTVGAQDPTDRSYVVQSSTSTYVVRVAEYSVRQLVENARSAYLSPPATPTPKP